MNKSEEVLVYFHGSFGFRRIEGYVEAYVPNIDAHVNLIGTWAGLHAMKPGFEYKLEGIARGKQRPAPDPDVNVVFDELGEPKSDKVFCKITVPWPEQVQSLCPEPIKPTSLFSRITSGAGTKIPKPSQLSHVQLYRFRTDGNPLRFVERDIVSSEIQEAPAPEPAMIEDEEGYRIYHLFCEPPHVFPTKADRLKKVAALAENGGSGHGMGGGHGSGAAAGLDAIQNYAPFTKHEHIALQEVLRMFPELENVEVNIPDAVAAADSPPSQAPGNGIRPKDLRSLFHLYPHFEGGPPACNPGDADGGGT